MKTNKISLLYDEEYARNYDDRFIYDDDYKETPEFELEVLSKLISVSDNWLDVGCGTGYFMSKFPDIQRAGLDISEGMLKVARERNPTALFLEQGDFRLDRPDWKGKWDLVSCMWCAYCYVESMSEIDTVIQNLSNWTSENGICFLPICDIEDVTYGRAELPHEISDIEIFGGPSYLNGVVWTYVDSKYNKKHENLLSPHIEYLIQLFKKSFDRVETIYYPPFPHPIPGQRKALIGFGKSGKLNEETEKTINQILKKSKEHKANVLSYQKALERFSQVQSENKPQITESDQKVFASRVGWLRKVWRKSPKKFQNIVRKILGETNA